MKDRSGFSRLTSSFHVEPSVNHTLESQSSSSVQHTASRMSGLDDEQGGSWQSQMSSFQVTLHRPMAPQNMDMVINDEDDSDYEVDDNGEENEDQLTYVDATPPALLTNLQLDLESLNLEVQNELDDIRELADALQPPEKEPNLSKEARHMLSLYQYYIAGDYSRTTLGNLIGDFWRFYPDSPERIRFRSPYLVIKNCALLLRWTCSNSLPSYKDPLCGQTVWYKPLIGVMEMLLADGRVTSGWQGRYDPSSRDTGHPVNSTHWREAEEHFRIYPNIRLLGLSVFVDGFAPRKWSRRASYYSISIGFVNPSFSSQALSCSKALVMAVPGECDLRLAIQTCIVQPLLDLRAQSRGCFTTSFACGTELKRDLVFRPFVFVVCGDDPGQRDVSGLAGWKRHSALRRFLEPSREQQSQEAEWIKQRTAYEQETRRVASERKRLSTRPSASGAAPVVAIPPPRPVPITVAPSNLVERNVDTLHEAMAVWERFVAQRSAVRGEIRDVSAQTVHEYLHPIGMKSSVSLKEMSSMEIPIFWALEEFRTFGNYFLKFGICILHAINLGIIKWFFTNIGAYLPSGAQSHINDIMTSPLSPAKFRTPLFSNDSSRDNPSVNSATGSWWQSFLFDRIDQVLADYMATLTTNEGKLQVERLHPALHQLRQLTSLLYCDFNEATQGKSFEELKMAVSDMTLAFKKQCVALFFPLDACVSFDFPNWHNIDAFYHLIGYLGAPKFYNTQRFEAVHFELKRLVRFSNHRDLAREMTHKSQLLNMDAVAFLVAKSSEGDNTKPSVRLLLARGTTSLPLPTSLLDTWNSSDRYRHLFTGARTGAHRRYGVLHSIPNLDGKRVASVSCPNRLIEHFSQCVASFLVDDNRSTYALKDIWTFFVFGEKPRSTHVWIELVKVIACNDHRVGFPRGQNYFQIEGQEPARSFLVPERDSDPALPDCAYRADWSSIPPNKLHTIWKPLDEVRILEIEKWSAKIYQGGLYWTKPS